jgi:phosphate transport system protein
MVSREHTDREYENELRKLREQLLLMGAKVEEMLANCIKALVQRDSDLAHHMIVYDNEIDTLEVGIDEHCLRILAKRQPVASDLRFITTALKFVTDLERIGDLGVNICERAIELNTEPPIKPYIDLPKMAEIVQEMIRETLDAFVTQNADRAQAVLERDNLVDAYYGQVFRDLLTYMMADPRVIHTAIKVQSVAKYLERMGDHTINLAEMVVFMIRGKDIRHPGRQKKPVVRPHGVLFLCRQNAARSQMAEAWARKLFPPGIRIWSGGSEPADAVDARAISAMREVGIDISHQRPKRANDIPLGDIDTVITLCSEEICTNIPGDLHRESWDLPDPARATGSDQEILRDYRQVRDAIRAKLETYMKTWR